jgi:spore coat protein H
MRITQALCPILGILLLTGSAACGGMAMRPSGAGDAGVPCGPFDPALVEADAANLFDYPHVPAFDLYLPKDEWENLQKNARDEQFVPVQACFEGKSIGQIGLRFKGYYGSLANCFDSRGEMICSRLSMKIKFSEYDDTLRFHGLKRLNFHAYRYDDSRIREKLTYDLFRAMGVVAPRTSWAVVRVNGETQGLFGMVEEVDGRFTSDRWPDMSNGNLYKEVWPTRIDAGQILAGLKTNEDVANVSAFQGFAQAVTDASDDQLRSTLGKYTESPTSGPTA